jgi:uncharacterized protein YkwD
MVRAPASEEDVKFVREGAWNRLRPRIYLVAKSCDQEVPLMLRLAAFVLVFLALSAAPAAAAPVLVPQTPRPVSQLAGSILDELNRVRAARGLRPLRAAPALAASARRHSAQMGRRGFFAHESADGTPFWRRIERSYAGEGFRSWEVGENIFWQSPATMAAISVVRSWLASPGHRANVLSRTWRDAGVGAVSMPSAPGVYRGAPVTIVTVDFGKRRR